MLIKLASTCRLDCTAMEVQRTVLDSDSTEYQEVLDLFNQDRVTRGTTVRLLTVERVHNPVLDRRFRDTEREYERRYGHVRTVRLWHGTKRANVDSILRDNYDVTRHGQGVGHRFGAGVSFSSKASYASNYCDSAATDYMLLNNVLVSNIVEVPENRSRSPDDVLREPPFIPGSDPPMRYDTTAKNKVLMDVIVKFHDDAYLPTHVVTFTRS